MKDSYSFDIDGTGLKAAYHAHREAYQRIFDRLQVRYVIVSAVSGAMGGSASEEFLAESPSGEDTFVRCLSPVTRPMSRRSSPPVRRRCPQKSWPGCPSQWFTKPATPRLSPAWWPGRTRLTWAARSPPPTP